MSKVANFSFINNNLLTQKFFLFLNQVMRFLPNKGLRTLTLLVGVHPLKLTKQSVVMMVGEANFLGAKVFLLG